MDVTRGLDICIMDRDMIDHTSPLMWCRVFLKGLELGGASSELSYSLLVKADVLFTVYVGMCILKRTQGRFLSIRYAARVFSDGCRNGLSVVTIGLKWNFYDRVKKSSSTMPRPCS